MLALALAVLLAVVVWDSIKGSDQQDRAALEAAVATIQAFGALAVMAATIVLAHLTGDYVRETRRIADLTQQQEVWRRNVQAADALASCLEDIRWETSEKFGAPASLSPGEVRELCRRWQRTWRMNRALIFDNDLRTKAESFEQLTREARELTGATQATATQYAGKLAAAADPLIDAFDSFRSKLPSA